MPTSDDLPVEITHKVRDTCLCLNVQRAAQAVAGRYDEALRPFELAGGQLSLLMSFNRPEAPTVGSVSALLWERTQAAVERLIAGAGPDALRADLRALSS